MFKNQSKMDYTKNYHKFYQIILITVNKVSNQSNQNTDQILLKKIFT